MELKSSSKFQTINYFYFIYNFLGRYPTSLNLSYLWNFGFSSAIFLLIQLVTGIFLSMHYVANVDYAFFSIESIMRDVNYGWLLRYFHSNGASFFFFCVYVHLFRNLFFLSFLPPKRGVWNLGIIIMFLMIIAAFTGYVLPWGQMSFWAATVITNLCSVIPIIGNYIVIWLWGGYSINTETLNRFFSFHFLVPFVILVLVLFHIILLHHRGSSNKLKVNVFFDKVMFNPFFVIKDLYFIVILFFIFFIFVGFLPNYLGHPDNYIQADPLVTPSHIVPEWYFLPFYAILRSIPSKIVGVTIMFLSILVLILFPFFILNRSVLLNFHKWHVKLFFKHRKQLEREKFFKNIMEFIWFRRFDLLFWLVFFNCVFLGLIGSKPIEYPFLTVGRICSLFYFYYFYYLVKNLNNINSLINMFKIFFWIIPFYFGQLLLFIDKNLLKVFSLIVKDTPKYSTQIEWAIHNYQ